MLDQRRHNRIVPRMLSTSVSMADGRCMPVQIVNVSRSGVAIDVTLCIADQLAVTMVGRTLGRAIRTFMGGVAVEFHHPIPEHEFGVDIVL